MTINTQQLKNVTDALRASSKPEWAPIAEEFFSDDAEDTPIKSQMLAQIHEGLEHIPMLAGRGQWKSMFRTPQQISPIAYATEGDFAIEMTKYVNVHIWDFHGKASVFDVGCGSALTLMVLGSLGVPCAGAEINPIWRAGGSLSGVLNNIPVDIRADDKTAKDFDIILFAQVFYDPAFASKNLDYARKLHKMGKRVLVSSPTLWLELNQFTTLEKGKGRPANRPALKEEGRLLFEMDWGGQYRPLFDLSDKDTPGKESVLKVPKGGVE